MRLSDLRARLTHGTAPLPRLCEFLLTRWPLFVLLCLVLLALCFIPAACQLMGLPFALHWWWTLLAALAALPVMLCLVYVLHPLPPSPGWRFSRQPLSPAGDAQVVLADTSLLTDGQRELLMALPLEPPAELRKGPGTVSLAMAMAYTAQLQNQETAPILLDAAAALGVNLENLTRLRPVIGRTQLGPVPGVIVEDGKGQASYFAGDPAALCELCGAVDGRRPRPIAPEDQAHIRDAAQSLRRQGGLPIGFAVMDTASGSTAPVYLGMLAMRDVVSEDAAAAVQALLDAGYSLQTQPIDGSVQPPMRLAALRQRLGLTDALYGPQIILSTDMLDTRALCITAADHRHRRFDAPVLLIREWFGKLAAWLRVALGCALPLLLGCVLGPANPLCCLAAAGLLTAALSAAASDDRCWDIAGLVLLIAALLLRLFLCFAAPALAGPAMGVFAVAAAVSLSMHLSYRWQITLACGVLGVLFLLLAWLLPGLPPLIAFFALMAGALAGLGAGQLLRLP